MKLHVCITLLICSFIASTQCALKDRLDAAFERITNFKQNIKAGKINVADRCGGGCGKSCSKTCEKG
jgi:hypothetical protein